MGNVPTVNFRSMVRCSTDDLWTGVQRTSAKCRQQPTVVKDVRQSEISNLSESNQRFNMN